MADYYEQMYQKYRDEPEVQQIRAALLNHIDRTEHVPFYLVEEEWAMELYSSVGKDEFFRIFRHSDLRSLGGMNPDEVIRRARFGPVSKLHGEADVLLPMLVRSGYEVALTFRNPSGALRGTWFWDVYLLARSDYAKVVNLAYDFSRFISENEGSVAPPPPAPEPEPEPEDPTPETQPEAGLSTPEQRSKELALFFVAALNKDTDAMAEAMLQGSAAAVKTYRKVHAALDRYLS